MRCGCGLVMFSFDCCLVVPEAALVLIHEDNIYRFFFFFLTFFFTFFFALGRDQVVVVELAPTHIDAMQNISNKINKIKIAQEGFVDSWLANGQFNLTGSAALDVAK